MTDAERKLLLLLAKRAAKYGSLRHGALRTAECWDLNRAIQAVEDEQPPEVTSGKND